MKHRIYTMGFASVYPLYIKKAERKNRTKDEVDELICWLTGHDDVSLQKTIDDQITFEEFFTSAPKLNPERKKITGVVCGVRVEDIEEPLMQEIRYMDKIIDELAKGKSLENIRNR